MSEIVVLPFAADADVERFRRALVSSLEERAGDATTHRVVITPLNGDRESTSGDAERVVVVAVEASPEGLRRLWQAGLEHPAIASDARGFVIIGRAPIGFGEPDPSLALPATLTRLFDRPRPDPAWRLADVSVSDALAAAAGRPDGDDRPVYALREADGLDAPTTREAAALEGHYRTLVDRLFPTPRRRPVAVPDMAAPVERQLHVEISSGDPRPFELDEAPGVVVLVAPSGAGKSVFVRGLAERRHLPIVRLSTVSAPEQLARRLRAATVADGRLRCVIDEFEASAAWLGHMKQATFAEELVDALREIRESRGATEFDLVLALRPSEHVETLIAALRALGPVTPVRLARLDTKLAHDFARTHVGDDAGILLRRLDEIGVTAHREDLRFFGDLCAHWRLAPDEFTADPVAVMGFGMDRRLAPADKTTTWSAPARRETAAAVAFAGTLTNRLRVAALDTPHDPNCLTETELVRLTREDRRRLWDTLSVDRVFESDTVSTGFQHESDREFLAAEHLAALPSHLVARWMVVGDGEHARVPFSLRAVARWLLLRAPEERVRWLLKVEPTLVVEALPWLRPELQAPAVEALIAAHRAGRFPIWEAEFRLADGFTLHGSGVRELLTSTLSHAADRFVRRFAARALSHLQDPSVAALLADLALDPAEETDVRVAAAASVVQLGDDAAIRSLEPLLDLAPAEDPDLELRGLALRALWPRYIDARRLFGALEPWPKREYFGAYAGLFWHAAETLAGIRAADLPIAVEWAAGKLTDPDVIWVGESTGQDVARFALELARRALALRSPGDVGSPWVELCIRAMRYRQVEALRRPQDQDLWRTATRAFVSRMVSPREIDVLLTAEILGREDLDWVLAEAELPNASRAWATLAVHLWHPEVRPELVDAIRALPGAVEAAPHWFGTIELDGERELNRQVTTEPVATPAEPQAPPSAAAILSMDYARAGDRWVDLHWWALCQCEWQRLHGGSVDAFRLPGAPGLDTPDEGRVIDAATEFIASLGATPEHLTGQRLGDTAPARAFGTLAIHAPDRLRALGPEVLGAWAPLAVDGFPPDDRGPWLRLLWAEAPMALRAALHQVAGDDSSSSVIGRTLTELDRPAAIELAFEFLEADGLAESVRRVVLGVTLERDEAARTRARAWALAHLERAGVETALLQLDPEPVLVRHLLANGRAEHAARLLSTHHDQVGVRRGRVSTLEKLSLNERAALVEALLALESRRDAFSSRALTRTLIQSLVDTGEVAALTDLASRHPEFQPDAERARVQRAQLDWRPPTLEDLIAGSPRIDTIEGLQRRTLDALEEIQRFDLDGDCAYTEGLWNEASLKQETDLRNWLKVQLNLRVPAGVIVARAEGEQREGRQRTDLVVERTEGNRALRVVVEVKRAPDAAPGTVPAKGYTQLAGYLDALAGLAEVRGILVVFIADARRKGEWIKALAGSKDRLAGFVFCVPPRPGKRGQKT